MNKELQLTRYAAWFFSDIIDKNPEIANCPKGEGEAQWVSALLFVPFTHLLQIQGKVVGAL